MKTRIALLLVLFSLLCTAACAQALKTPPGCAAAPDAKLGDGGYADHVTHEKTGVELILIPAGSFTMGTNDKNATSQVSPAHTVTLAKPFYMGKTEVTNGQYKKFMAAVPEYKGEKDCDPFYDLYVLHLRGKSLMSAADEYPVVWVSWGNALAFCKWAGLALPSEAQWEYACRAGTTTKYSFGDNDKDIYNYGWVDYAAEHHTHPVATKLPNPWGLYDMHGNAWEWTLDDFITQYKDAPTDGSARVVPGELTKVLRGGSWSTGPGVHQQTPDWFYSAVLGCVARYNVAPGDAANDRGFRVILPIE